ncbi:MAG TPA: tetratricopeptide repeat protein, partial [Opitutaceae bacterium]
MSAHLERAQLLLQQSRPVDAEREALLALTVAPDQPLAHAYLALSRSDQNRPLEAIESAETAVGYAPDSAFFHYVYAIVLHRADRESDARREISEAIRIDPETASHFSLLASIELAERRWPAALEAAERGLALDPQDVGCANLRSMALVRMGRKAEAMEAVDFALAREPHNALSHANQGWNYLHHNNPSAAQTHFREALRLNPQLEYARSGMLEALKARNPVYRGMLAYFLWMGRQSRKLQGLFIVVTYFGVNGMSDFASKHPESSKFIWPLLIAFYVFTYLTWTAGTMFNLLLRLNRFGRYVLSRDERVATNWFAACLLGVAVGVYYWIHGSENGLLGAVISAILSIGVAV